MFKKTAILLLLILLICQFHVQASPRTVMISTFSSSSWLPDEVNKNACRLVDEYMMNIHNTAVFDGSKSPDKKAMSQRISKEANYVIYMELTGFYDPPYKSVHLNSNIKPSDTVSSAILEYTIYVVSSNQWITGRINQQVIYPGTTVPVEVALPDTVNQLLPKLTIGLNKVINQ